MCLFCDYTEIVRFVGVGGDVRACVACFVSIDVVCIPSTQRSGTGFVVRACAQTIATAAPDYNTSSSSIIASRRWSRILAPQRVNPILLRWAERVTSLQTFTHQQQCYSSANLSLRKCNSILILVLTAKWALNFQNEWGEGVAPCSDF